MLNVFHTLTSQKFSLTGSHVELWSIFTVLDIKRAARYWEYTENRFTPGRLLLLRLISYDQRLPICGKILTQTNNFVAVDWDNNSQLDNTQTCIICRNDIIECVILLFLIYPIIILYHINWCWISHKNRGCWTYRYTDHTAAAAHFINMD